MSLLRKTEIAMHADKAEEGSKTTILLRLTTRRYSPGYVSGNGCGDGNGYGHGSGAPNC